MFLSVRGVGRPAPPPRPLCCTASFQEVKDKQERERAACGRDETRTRHALVEEEARLAVSLWVEQASRKREVEQRLVAKQEMERAKVCRTWE